MSDPPPVPSSTQGATFLITELRTSGVDAHVALAGEIDLDAVDGLCRTLEAAGAEPVEAVHLDLSEVGFASLAALAAVVDAAHSMHRRGGRILLSGTTPLHRRVLALLRPPAALVVTAADPG